MSRKLLPIVLVLLAFLASGCFDSDVSIVVEEDGSGTLATQLSVAADSAVGIGQFMGATGDSCDVLLELTGESADGVDLAASEQDGQCVLDGAARFDDLEQARIRLESLVGASGAVSAETLRFEESADGWVFELAYTPIDDAAGVSFEDLGEAGEVIGFGDGTLTVSVRLPGEVVAHSGDEIAADGTVTWELDPFGEPSTLSITTEGSGASGVVDDLADDVAAAAPEAVVPESDDDGSSVGIIIGVVVVGALVIVAAGAAWFRMKRRSST